MLLSNKFSCLLRFAAMDDDGEDGGQPHTGAASGATRGAPGLPLASTMGIHVEGVTIEDDMEEDQRQEVRRDEERGWRGGRGESRKERERERAARAQASLIGIHLEGVAIGSGSG